MLFNQARNTLVFSNSGTMTSQPSYLLKKKKKSQMKSDWVHLCLLYANRKTQTFKEWEIKGYRLCSFLSVVKA